MFETAFAAARDRQRLQEIASVLAGYGINNVLDKLGLRGMARFGRKPAVDVTRMAQPERVRRAIENLGPTFVKLGQLLASRPDLLPPAWTEELGRLHSQVSPVPFSEMLPQLEKGLGGSPQEVFAAFSTEAIASASIAQVYRARLHTGEDVVVKVLRPGLRRVIEADLRLLGHATTIAERRWPELSRYRPHEQLRHLSTALAGELNLVNEATHCELLASLFPGSDEIRFPKIHWQWTSEHVLVQEYLDGVPPTDAVRVREAGLDTAVLAQRLIEAFLNMALVEGTFHADPHPGNLLGLPGSRIGFLDFGAIGRLTERRRSQLLILIGSVLKQDADAMMGVLLDWSGASNPDLTRLDTAAHTFIIRHSRGPLDIGLVLQDFMTMARENDLSMPTDLAILFKALITTDGVMRQLDPHFDLFAAAGPAVAQRMRARFSFENLLKKAQNLGFSLYGAASELPSIIHLLLVRLKQGKVTVEIEIKGIDRLINGLERAAARLSIAIVVAALVITVAPRLVGLGTPFFAFVVTLVGLLAVGGLLILRRKR
ncbi:AarF/UbiB family protein [Enterovirga sp.]|uniref:ABC1 kinase family protein n=1 Tax=Enterovirga sp. TaxID=2026350 RepID=UPI0026244BB9|nr:AarF/UbiB family protein [Enterovirga sp.]MDB5592708.1 transporter [Enterovirga sp.]